MRKKKKEDYKTIPLIEVKQMLGFLGQGYRSVLKWCKEHQIIVFGKGRRQRILKSDWVRTQLAALKKAAIYTSPETRQKLIDRGLIDPPPGNDRYTPKSDIAKDFMNRD